MYGGRQGTKQKIFLLWISFIYSLLGTALPSTTAPIPINMEIKCLFHFHLGSCSYLTVQ